MYVLRGVEKKDLTQLLELSKEAGVGMTSMPNDKATWLGRIEHSMSSFDNELGVDEEGTYFLVLEDQETKKLLGCTAVYANVGMNKPFYSYKVSRVVKYSRDLDQTVHMDVLHLVNDLTGTTELGSLFLTESARRSAWGQFLSRSRYLLLADFPHLFNKMVMAELRGWQDDKGSSPFWEDLGKKFFGLAFENADYMTAIKGTQIISDLMPRYPIYVDLLPESAREVVGKAHKISSAALSLLKKEGFHFLGYVDVFDAGPSYGCRRELIHSVKESETYTFIGTQKISGKLPPYIISNKRKLSYRIVMDGFIHAKEGLYLSKKTAEALELKKGDQVRILAIRERKK